MTRRYYPLHPLACGLATSIAGTLIGLGILITLGYLWGIRRLPG